VYRLAGDALRRGESGCQLRLPGFGLSGRGDESLNRESPSRKSSEGCHRAKDDRPHPSEQGHAFVEITIHRAGGRRTVRRAPVELGDGVISGASRATQPVKLVGAFGHALRGRNDTKFLKVHYLLRFLSPTPANIALTALVSFMLTGL